MKAHEYLRSIEGIIKDRSKIGSKTHLITDPPYSQETHNGMRGNRGTAGIVTRDCGFGTYTEQDINEFATAAVEIITGWIVIFSDDRSLSLWRSAIQSAGGKYRRTVPWVRWSCPQFNRLSAPSTTEYIVTAVGKCGGRNYWLDQTKSGGYYDTPCLRAKSLDKIGHSTEKPVPLMEEIIKDVSPSWHDMIVDPHCGAGATVIAASGLGLGRHVMYHDLEPRWVEVTRLRLSGEIAEAKKMAQIIRAEHGDRPKLSVRRSKSATG